MHTAVRSGALVGGAVGVALIALIGTLRFETSAEGANSPRIADRAWLSEAPAGAHINFRSWREVIGEPSPSSCERREFGGTAAISGRSMTCQRALGALPLVDHTSHDDGFDLGSSTSRTLTLNNVAAAGAMICEVMRSYYFGRGSDRSSWNLSADLLYAHDPRLDLHGYRCVALAEGGPVTHWTQWIHAPNAQKARMWRASRPLVPHARLAAALLLACATVIMAHQLRRDRIDALPWREARRGADGVLRLGEIVVQTPSADAAVTEADTVCVVVADEQDSGIYRTAATVTAVRVRVGSHDAHQRAGRWARRVSAVVAVALAAASVAASAWLIVLSLRR